MKFVVIMLLPMMLFGRMTTMVDIAIISCFSLFLLNCMMTMFAIAIAIAIPWMLTFVVITTLGFTIELVKVSYFCQTDRTSATT